MRKKITDLNNFRNVGYMSDIVNAGNMGGVACVPTPTPLFADLDEKNTPFTTEIADFEGQ